MKNNGLVIILLFVVVSIVILSFVPPVFQLGSWIRLIIFHGNLNVVSLYLFYAAGLLGLVAFVAKKHDLARWSQELGLQAVIIWFAGTILSLFSMRIAWGGMLWTEPRTVSALVITLLGVGKEYLLRNNSAPVKTFALANAVFAFAVLIIRSMLTFVMHPDNPVGKSDSQVIRLLFPLLLLYTLLSVILLARLRLAEKNQKRTE